MADLWNDDVTLESLEIDVPAWIEQDLTCADVAAIVQGGCASGAYMPAVSYGLASDMMAKHGDDVLQYLQDALGELPTPPDDVSWSGLACHYLAYAVDMWAASVEDAVSDALDACEGVCKPLGGN